MTNGNDLTDSFAATSEHVANYGLTKRELFAAMAMQGLFSNYKFMQDMVDSGKKHDAVVFAAVQAADTLITELNKTPC